MGEQHETIESLRLQLKESEEKNNNLELKVTELSTFIQKQYAYIKKLKEELSEKELLLIQLQQNSPNAEEKVSPNDKSPQSSLSIRIPSQGKIAYKYSKISSPTVDGTFASFSTVSPTQIQHLKHSSTDDNIVNKDPTQRRKLSHNEYYKKDSKFSASESNINLNNKLGPELINRPHDLKVHDINDNNVVNSLSCEFEDKEILAEQITVFILKLVYSKNDKNKKDISFIISIRNADSGDELWKIEKSYTDILNLENTLKIKYPKEIVQKIGKLPERNFNSLKTESKQMQLKITMEIYLQHLCNIFKNSVELATFLSKDIIDQNNDENNEKDANYKCGYLFKKNNFMGWRMKYFVLNNRSLSFYESKGGELCGNIHLSHAKVMPFNPNGLNREKFHHAFKIIEYKDSKNFTAKSIEDKIYAKHLLCSENDNDRDEWVEKIRFVIENLKKNEGYESANTSNIQLNMASIEKNSSCDLDSNNMTDEDDSISPKEKKEIITETIKSLNYNSNESECTTHNNSNNRIECNNETKNENIADENMAENEDNIVENNENNENIIENKENDDNRNDDNGNDDNEEINEKKENPENIIENKDNDENKDSNENMIENDQNKENPENVSASKENIENVTEGKEDIIENKEEENETNEANELNENNEIDENNETIETNEINEANETNEANEANEANETNETNEAIEANEANEISENNENNETNEAIGSPNNNGWDSSDSDEEGVDVIIDYDERNYLPEGFNFEEFEKQGLDINEYIRRNSEKSNKDNSESGEGQNYNEEQEENNEEEEKYEDQEEKIEEQEEKNEEKEERIEEQKENNEVQDSSEKKENNEKQDSINNYEHKNNDIIEEEESCNKSSYNKENIKSKVEEKVEKPANKEPVRNAIIDDNERVMQQIIPPPLMPKTKMLSQKQKLLKEEKQRRLHFSWYKFKKSSNDIDYTKDPSKNKKVFGVPLETAVKNSKIKDDYELPAIVYRCIEYLDAKGAYEEEGIYRLSGSKATIQSLKNRFDRYGDVNLLQDKEIYDVHVITGLLKLYLRELPTTIMTKEFQPRFIEIASIPNREEKVKALANLMSYLPLPNYTLLRCLAAHLVRIVQNSVLNKMTLSNIAIVFGPTLGIPIGLFILILSEFEAVFCWTTLKESEEEENIMSILFKGPEDYLNISSMTKAQRGSRNNLVTSSEYNINKSKGKESEEIKKFKSSSNVNGEESQKNDDNGGSRESIISPISTESLITGSTKLRRSNNNVNKEKHSTEAVDVIKEENEHDITKDIRELSLGTEIERLINEKCKNLDRDSMDETMESIMNSKDMNTMNTIESRRRQERCSSLLISKSQQIEYLKSLKNLHRLSYGDNSPIVGQFKVFNRNSQEYMDGVPDNFRLSEMFAKEIKISEHEGEDILEGKDIFYDRTLSQ